MIVYGDGIAAPEGIYSLNVDEEQDNLPTDTIIAFESMADAQRYCDLAACSLVQAMVAS